MPLRLSTVFCLIAGSAAALLLTVTGCANPDPVKRTKVVDLGSRNDDPFQFLPPSPTPEEFFSVAVQRLEFLPQADLEPAWALTTTDGLDAQQLVLWQRNGLRAALLDQAQAGDFYRAFLAGAVVNQTRMVRTAGELTTYQTSAPITQPVPLRLVSGADQTETMQLTSGRCQFVAQFRLQAGALAVALVPHHYQPLPSLVPRTIEMKELDGMIFRQLALNATLPPGKILLVGVGTELMDAQNNAMQSMGMDGVTLPPPAAGVPPAPASTQPSTPPATQPAPPRRVVVPDLLGARILTTWRQRTQTQILLIIGLPPEASIPAAAWR